MRHGRAPGAACATRCRVGAAVLLLLAVLDSPTSAKVFHAKDEALALAFPDAERIEERVLILTDAQKTAIEKLARAPLGSQLWTVYVGRRSDEILGYAVIDTHLVRTLPETFMVVLAPNGEVRRVEILAFHEPSEYMPTARWTGQFHGRSLDEDLKLGAGIHGITGATLSATALTAGVRRVLALHEVLTRDGLLGGK